ncbi:MAG: hypothetical protein HC778_01640 [Chamaesiphon sp. CSU_1_12]|nr:hypothetical protein [Chamaesiphon sp. CSU_1_12]
MADLMRSLVRVFISPIFPHIASIERMQTPSTLLPLQIFGVPFAAYKVLYFFELELNDVERVIPGASHFLFDRER